MKDYYAILEVPSNATAEQIRDQYRFMIQAWHPDKFSNPAQRERAAEKARDINEAYEVLSNAAQRASYDRSRITNSSARALDVMSLQRALEEQRKQAEQEAEYTRLYGRTTPAPEGRT